MSILSREVETQCTIIFPKSQVSTLQRNTAFTKLRHFLCWGLCSAVGDGNYKKYKYYEQIEEIFSSKNRNPILQKMKAASLLRPLVSSSSRGSALHTSPALAQQAAPVQVCPFFSWDFCTRKYFLLFSWDFVLVNILRLRFIPLSWEFQTCSLLIHVFVLYHAWEHNFLQDSFFGLEQREMQKTAQRIIDEVQIEPRL